MNSLVRRLRVALNRWRGYAVLERGVRVVIDRSVLSQKLENVLATGKYEAEESAIALEFVEPGDVVLELGGGLGYMSSLVAKATKAAKLHVVEANPDLLPVIAATHAANGLEGVRIERHNFVLTAGDAPATLPFYRRADFWASSLDASPGDWLDKVEVPTRDFADFVRETGATVLICDIEGGELPLLSAARLDGLKRIIVELHPNVYGAEGVAEVAAALTARGFTERQALRKATTYAFFADPSR